MLNHLHWHHLRKSAQMKHMFFKCVIFWERKNNKEKYQSLFLHMKAWKIK